MADRHKNLWSTKNNAGLEAQPVWFAQWAPGDTTQFHGGSCQHYYFTYSSPDPTTGSTHICTHVNK